MDLASKSIFLTPDQIAQFDKLGYLKIPGALNAKWVGKMRDYLEYYMKNGIEKVSHQDFGRKTKGNATFITSIRNIFNMQGHEFLYLLGCPELSLKIESLCGEDFVPLKDFAVIKHLQDGEKVDWHQDLVSQRKGRSIMFGIYLDPASATEGALEVIPKSQHKEQDICQLTESSKDTHILEMQAGDVLIHDPMIVHRSGSLTKQPIRRVVYFQCMSLHQLHNERLYSNQQINHRLQLRALAQEFYHHQNPDKLSHLLKEIYDHRIEHKAANFCQDFT